MTSSARPVALGVNIDHVATVRQARRGRVPSVLDAAREVMAAGADGITVHLREDRRHIQEDDVAALLPEFRVNLEMAATDAMVEYALGKSSGRRPHSACLVPERREELTTEGGLNVAGSMERIREVTGMLKSAGIVVSLFVDPDPWQLEGAARAGADFVELHTGRYAELFPAGGEPLQQELRRLRQGASSARLLGLRVNAGHGLDFSNTPDILSMEGLEELNIGFSIVARSIFVGLREAVREMKAVMEGATR